MLLDFPSAADTKLDDAERSHSTSTTRYPETPRLTAPGAHADRRREKRSRKNAKRALRGSSTRIWPNIDQRLK